MSGSPVGLDTDLLTFRPPRRGRFHRNGPAAWCPTIVGSQLACHSVSIHAAESKGL